MGCLALKGFTHTCFCCRFRHGDLGRVGEENRVVFVRHALPGERVVLEVTEGTEGDRFWRADAVEVLEPSPDRVGSLSRWHAAVVLCLGACTCTKGGALDAEDSFHGFNPGCFEVLVTDTVRTTVPASVF